MEIDLENWHDELKNLLWILGVEEKQVVRMGTEAIYTFYGKDYFKELVIH